MFIIITFVDLCTEVSEECLGFLKFKLLQKLYSNFKQNFIT